MVRLNGEAGLRPTEATHCHCPNPPKNPQFKSQRQKHNDHPLKSKVHFPETKTQTYIFMKRQQRKNTNQLGVIFGEDTLNETRLIMAVEEPFFQCKHLPWYQCRWLSAESVKTVIQHSSLEICRTGMERPYGRVEKTSTLGVEKPKLY